MSSTPPHLRLGEARQLARAIWKDCAKHDPQAFYGVDVAGSIRRKCNYVRDIDLVCLAGHVTDLRGALVYALTQVHHARTGNHGDLRSQFFVPDPVLGEVQVDVWWVPQEHSRIFTLLHATGSKWLNIRMRNAAKAKGWKLNEYGLRDRETDEEIQLEPLTEAQVFTMLGMKYVLPCDRGSNLD